MHSRILVTLAFVAIAFCGQQTSAQTISGTVDYEDLFIRVFTPGTGDGISIDTNNDIFVGNSVVGTGTSLSNSGFEDVDLDGDGVNDVRVNVSYTLQKTGDSRIGFRQNTAGTALTLFSDSNAGTDFDYGFLSINYDVDSLIPSFGVTQIQDLTTSSLNGETELYEFGIIDEGAANITTSAIAAYNAQLYDGGDGVFSGATNSLGDVNEILLPEFLAASADASVTFDAEATITGDLGNNPGTLGDASDQIGLPGFGVLSLIHI